MHLELKVQFFANRVLDNYGTQVIIFGCQLYELGPGA
jgi:hypothetical protein